FVMPPFMQTGDGLAIWATAFALGVFAVLAGLLGLFFPRLARLPVLPTCWIGLVQFVAVIQLLELLAVVQNLLQGTPLLLAKSGFPRPGLVLLRSPRAPPRGPAPAPARSPRLALTSIFVGLGLNLWIAYSLAEAPIAELDMPMLPPVDLVEIPNSPARTDKGTPIPLFVNEMSKRATAGEEISLLKNLGMSLGVIRATPPDPVTNCHGWVFAGGQYHVTGRSVPQILEENGYRPVEKPEAGDLIAYRTDFGEVTHTGVVRAVGPANF